METTRNASLIEAEQRLSYLEKGLTPIQPDVRKIIVSLYTDFIRDCEEEALEFKGQSEVTKDGFMSTLNRYNQFRRDAAQYLGEGRVEEIFGLEEELGRLREHFLEKLNWCNMKQWWESQPRDTDFETMMADGKAELTKENGV